MLRKAVIRADASQAIGTGHVMRCLTLANALASVGVRCTFVYREQLQHLETAIRGAGFDSVQLNGTVCADGSREPAANGERDDREMRSVLASIGPDLLVVDHYSLDWRWESALRAPELKVLVIDDLANRRHACDVLLDQNLGRIAGDYAALVPADCLVLAGSEYALLRPEFRVLRESGLRRRVALERVLMTFGGVDQDDVTGQVLESLRGSALQSGCRISIVMGREAPHLAQVSKVAATMPWATEVLVDVRNMAHLMAACDLAIGAAGGTAWERCCLGLPSLLVLQAENQRPGAEALHAAGASYLLGAPTDVGRSLHEAVRGLVDDPPRLARMSEASARIVDGKGADRVLARLATCYASS
jgi:UDP-2,4-diacetamido-2,4,6-trideoxy-beta-L-altropyranose hydrolase